MLTLIKQAQVYAPGFIGTQDVLFASGKVLQIADNIELSGSADLTVIDGQGMKLIPGLIDSLVHISGGGGEGGFHTRTPQMELTEATTAGVTTVIGALGTDDVSRTLEDLLAKAYGLEQEGLNAFIHCGSYQVPVETLTGSVRRDLMLIPKVIGVGELALSDHRGSHPSVEELTRIAADSRVGGMLAGKKGTVFLHLGDHEEKLNLVNQVIQTSAIPASQFFATHINRSLDLLEDGAKFAAYGGFIDMTTSTTPYFIEQGEVPAAKAVEMALELGAPLSQLTMSSDGNASLPEFNDDGALVGLSVGRVHTLFDSFNELTKLIGFEDALTTVTLNPAVALGLETKGRIQTGLDADLVLLNDNQQVQYVWSKGQLMVENGEAVKQGTFE